MYQKFGAEEIGDTGCVRFTLFVPDSTLDPSQYSNGGLPGIDEIYVRGDFQKQLGGTDWTSDPEFKMTVSQYTDPEDGKTKGWLYELETKKLLEGFYQYKYYVNYSGGGERYVCDPCTRYGTPENQNSGFVIGGPDMKTVPHPEPRPLSDLVIYELMVDDFTATIRGNRAPLAVVTEKLSHLENLGVNAIQIMPWVQWPRDSYNWGYEPQGYFAVAFPYTLNPSVPSEKLFLLKRLISECHKKKMHVIFDAVFDHVTKQDSEERGFGYHWLWKNPKDSPYTGKFAGSDYGEDLDYSNGCILDFIFDVCRYWIEDFCIDGIRFDYTDGFYKSGNMGQGLPSLIKRLRDFLDSTGRASFPLILEHKWEYSSIGVVNTVKADSCWLDPFRSLTRGYLTNRHIRPDIMRMVNAGRDFEWPRMGLTYIENHDHERITVNAGSREEWWRTQPYAIALYTSPGAPMIFNGQEFASMYPMPEPFQETGAGDSQDPRERRVVPRPLLWSQLEDGPGRAAFDLYRRLIKLRLDHPGLSAPFFYPPEWDERNSLPDRDGFGIDEGKQTLVYHRSVESNGRQEKFYVVLNFSAYPQTVSVSFPEDEGWEDLLSGWRPQVNNHWLTFEVGSNWGHVFFKRY